MPSFPIAFSSRTLTSTPSFSSALARSANSAGKENVRRLIDEIAGKFDALGDREIVRARRRAPRPAWPEPMTNSGAPAGSPPPALSCGSCTCRTDSREGADRARNPPPPRRPKSQPAPRTRLRPFARRSTLPKTNPPSMTKSSGGVVLARRDADDDKPRGVETGRRKNVQRRALGAAEIRGLGGGANQRLEIANLRGHRRGRLHVSADEYDERAALGRGQGTKGDLDGSAHVRLVPMSGWTPNRPTPAAERQSVVSIGGFAAPVNKSPRLRGTNR